MPLSSSGGKPLKRVLSLPLVVLYGLGVTVGAGIYVLVGETAGRAGMLAPFSFLVAALVMLFPALCFAELSGRYPYASGAAYFVQESFRSDTMGLITGLMMIAAGSVAASTISLGSVAYLSTLTSLPAWALTLAVVIAMGAIAAWGIKESVIFAGLLTLIELGGLAAVIIGGFVAEPHLLSELPQLLPKDLSGDVTIPVIQASLIAFFAFIGFEGISNIAEETKNPQRTLPRAILLTLALSTIIYLAVVSVALLTVGATELASQSAPLAHVFTRTTGLPPSVIGLVAVFATLNGIIVQIIMVSRLAYGMSVRGLLPAFLGVVNSRTQTPVVATVIVTMIVLLLSLALPVVVLAEWTSRIILLVFTLVCLALLRLKWQSVKPPPNALEINPGLPAIGTVACGTLLIADLIWG